MAIIDDIPVDYLEQAQADLAKRCPDLELRASKDGLCLAGDGMELRVDFAELLPRVKPGRLQQELLVKAAKIKGGSSLEQAANCNQTKSSRALRAVDATAGLGEDSFLLAAAGFEVVLCEQDPVILALLVDALLRAYHSDNQDLASIVARMTPINCNSVSLLNAIGLDINPSPAVVLLDPMFPSRTKSALVKKKFQLLHHLQRPCTEDEEATLLEAALHACPRKIIIKRPLKGPYLAGRKPSYSISGKAVRYDCIAFAS